jgi:4-hydroxythreonine-4-phosphate dehydrogenase
MKKPISIAISMGEPSGIGPEVIVKALKGLRRIKDAIFFVTGDSFVLSRYGIKSSPNLSLVDINNITPSRFNPGSPSEESARASLEYLNAAVSLIKRGICQGLVTGPISKEAVFGAGFLWPGHTEFLAHAFGVKRVAMVFVSDRFKVALASRHVSLKQVVKDIRREDILSCAAITLKLLKRYFKVKKPKIAVSGLNPHAGEAGLFGREEIEVIAPAIKKLNKNLGKHFFGPFAPDTVFYRAYQREFDMVIAMYHDQGLIPFKMVEFREGVHVTAGLPFIRTSPVHGTAFDIAGKNTADHRSMLNAILLAYQLTKNNLAASQ